MLTSPNTLKGHFRLGDLDLDIDQRRLTRQGQDLRLSKLTFRLLHVLASAAPAMVTKDEMADRVWSGLVVSPETVTQRIKLLRDALQDDAQHPRYIEVVHGQGYRWIPAVEPIEHPRQDATKFLGNPDFPEETNLTLPSQPSIAILPLDNFDIIANSGGSFVAHNETFTTTVTDGQLNISFIPVLGEGTGVFAITVVSAGAP
jgi:DNA-binding winged helix-turn-helix (wHTH) protein